MTYRARLGHGLLDEIDDLVVRETADALVGTRTPVDTIQWPVHASKHPPFSAKLACVAGA